MIESAERGYHNAAALGPFGEFAVRLQRSRAPQVGARVGVQNSLQQAFAAKGMNPSVGRSPAVSVQMLTLAEEQQAKKFEKTLREIAALEMRMVRGEKLDRLQVEKMARRPDIEGSAVMRKLRGGWLRPAVKESGQHLS